MAKMCPTGVLSLWMESPRDTIRPVVHAYYGAKLALNLLLAAASPVLTSPKVTVTTAPAAVPTPLVLNAPLVTAPQTWSQLHNLGWLTHSIAGLSIAFAVSLVILLAIQTTKNEGLTGSIGGRVDSNYRGRMGGEEQLKRATGFVAVGFVVTAVILALTGI